jgi:hypothetical protein
MLARIGYAVRRLDRDTPITSYILESLENKSKLPPAAEQIDNLLIHIASTFRPGQVGDFQSNEVRCIVGAVTSKETRWVIEQAAALGHLNGRSNRDLGVGEGEYCYTGSLSLKGWSRYDELVRNGAGSRHAFMAMDFSSNDIRRLFDHHLQQAVAETGFDLRTTQGPHQTAGSIDNRMRVELRTARFVICDLSDGNRGAYWEAGFAEGLGRPVFYLCRRDVLEGKDPSKSPHFDTRQQLIIPWDLEDPASAMEELKATIRATLPAEAVMEDRLTP